MVRGGGVGIDGVVPVALVVLLRLFIISMNLPTKKGNIAGSGLRAMCWCNDSVTSVMLFFMLWTLLL